MNQDAMGTPGLGDSTYPTSLSKENICSMLRNVALAIQCLREISSYRRGEPWDEMYGLELLRRATRECDLEACTWVQYSFQDMVHDWLHQHPDKEAALRLESEENYITITFSRFWQATSLTKKVEFRTLVAALQYLRACLHGTILDTLRAYKRPKEVTLLDVGEPSGVDNVDSSEAWRMLQLILSDQRELRLAYLLYHCGLKPREIVYFCAQEWSDVQEIHCLRRNILDRLLGKRDQMS
jgi:hypothetical protein